MRLFLLRHAEAEAFDPLGGDEGRRLTAQGRARLTRAAPAFSALLSAVSLVLHSPFVRAAETAELACEALNHSPQRAPCEALVPEAPLQQIFEVLEQREASQVLLVGHNPHLSLLASGILNAREGAMQLSRGSLMALEVPHLRYPGTLEWLMKLSQLEAFQPRE